MVLLPSVTATVAGLLATAVAGAQDVGEEEVYAAYGMATATPPDDIAVVVLRAVRTATLANARALRRKDRLTSLALACLAMSMILIGVLNVASATLHS